jgi:AraC family transcriptional regulator, activator of mtrCDE
MMRMKDVLSDILDTVALKAAIYFRTDYHQPFGVAVPAFARAARFHLIVQGRCFVRLDGGNVVVALPGDIVFVPNGSAHVLASDREIQCKPLADMISESGFAGSGPFVIGSGPANESCQMICGHFSFAQGADHPLLRAVPDALHISAADRASLPMLDDVLRLVVRRMFADEPGVNASVSRLSEILYIEVLRAGVAQAPDMARLMSAVSDPQIGKALALIHHDVAAPWTVESLASAVAMSRSRFAERFSDLIGSGPLSYISEWRMQRALHLLNKPHASIKAIANNVGYQSAAAFSRAFAERFGVSPRDHKLASSDE